jgi:hypothetical protein
MAAGRRRCPAEPVGFGLTAELGGALVVELELELGVADGEHRDLLGSFAVVLHCSREGAVAT